MTPGPKQRMAAVSFAPLTTLLYCLQIPPVPFDGSICNGDADMVAIRGTCLSGRAGAFFRSISQRFSWSTDTANGNFSHSKENTAHVASEPCFLQHRKVQEDNREADVRECLAHGGIQRIVTA